MARSKQLDRVLKRLDAIPAAMKEAVVASLTKSANEIVDTMRSFVPVESGALRESIVVTLPGQSTPPYSTPGGRRVALPNQVLISAGNKDVRYAHLVEYGTAPHGVSAGAGTILGRIKARLRGGTMHPGSAPHPFFWPAYRLRKTRVKRRTSRDVFKAARQIWNNA